MFVRGGEQNINPTHPTLPSSPCFYPWFHITYCLPDSVTLWTVACQAPTSMAFSSKNAGVSVAIPFSGRFFQPRDWTQASRTAGTLFTLWVAREACLALTLWLTIPVESAVCQGLQKILKMQKTDPCLVQSSHLACVREGVKSLVIHSCGFSFCMSVTLEVWLVPGEMEVRAGTVEWAGRQASWGACEPLGRFPCEHDAPCASTDLGSPLMGAAELGPQFCYFWSQPWLSYQ